MTFSLILFDYCLGIRAKGLYLPIEMIRLLRPFLLLRSVEPPFVYKEGKVLYEKEESNNMNYKLSNAG